MASFQKQKGYTDCGLFAIANAYELASGNIHFNYKVSFDQSTMRKHQVNCLEKEEISSFSRARKTAAEGNNNKKTFNYTNSLYLSIARVWRHDAV